MAALGNLEEDNPGMACVRYGKRLRVSGDQDAIEVMCNDAPRAIIELEHMECLFRALIREKIASDFRPVHTNRLIVMIPTPSVFP